MVVEDINKEYIKPTKIFGNLYFIGTRLVCTHLIDTGDGLIIIDPGVSEGLNIITNNVRELGFRVDDIKYIIITHAHYDHMDSVKELVGMCGAKTLIARDDLPLLTGAIYHYPIKSFDPDVLLVDGDVIELGNTRINCVATPGHTDGTMSFFFDVSDGKETYRAGLFGGAGTNTLIREFMIKHKVPFDCRQKYVNSINKLLKCKVEIFLGNHLENNRTEEKLESIGKSDENPFIKNSQYEWESFLMERLNRIMQIIENDE